MSKTTGKFVGVIPLTERHHTASLLDAMQQVMFAGRADGDTVPEKASMILSDAVGTRKTIELSPLTKVNHALSSSLNYAIVTDCPDFERPLVVPSKAKEIRESVHGDALYFGSDFQDRVFCRLMEKLSTQIDEELSFKEVVRRNMMERVPGSYSAGIFALSSKPSFILAARGQGHSVHVAMILTKHVLAVAFSNDLHMLTKSLPALCNNTDSDNWFPSLTIEPITVNDGFIVLNPMYLASRYSKARTNSATARPPLQVLNLLQRHLHNLITPLQTQVEDKE